MLFIKLSLLALVKILLLASNLENPPKEEFTDNISQVKVINTDTIPLSSTEKAKHYHPHKNDNISFLSGRAVLSTGEYKYDPLTVEKINETLKDVFDINLNIMIGAYVCDNESFDDLHERVMDGVKQINEDNLDIDFHSESFAHQLNSLLKYTFDSLSKRVTFWHDLFRLLFKWTLFMRQKFADNDSTFEEMATNVENLYFNVINRRLNTFDFQTQRGDTLHPKKFDFSIFHDLIKYELLENIGIFSIFNLILNDFYGHGNPNLNHNKKQGKGQEQKFSCQDLKTKYFNGNFNNNKLLELMLLTYDHRGDIKICILQDSNDDNNYNNYKPKLFPDLIPIGSSTFNNFPQKIKASFRKVIENLEMNYMSISIAEFFLNNNLCFQIKDSTSLVIILKMLTKAGFLSWKPLNKILIFTEPAANNSVPKYLWNQSKFELFMKQQKGKGFTEDEYAKYISMI